MGPKRERNEPPPRAARRDSVHPSEKYQLQLARLKEERIGQIIQSVYGLGRITVIAGAWVLVAYWMFRGVAAIAGQDTNFKATVDAVVKMSLDRYILGLATVLASGGYFNEKRLRHQTIKDHKDHIHRLEKERDPARLQSGLSETGRPRKEHRDAP